MADAENSGAIDYLSNQLIDITAELEHLKCCGNCYYYPREGYKSSTCNPSMKKYCKLWKFDNIDRYKRNLMKERLK